MPYRSDSTLDVFDIDFVFVYLPEFLSVFAGADALFGILSCSSISSKSSNDYYFSSFSFFFEIFSVIRLDCLTVDSDYYASKSPSY
jgi:hypothetical protein